MSYIPKLLHIKQSMQVLTSSKSNEWYTPKWLVDKALEVLGTIDVDPASNPLANKWIKARRYYFTDGLSMPWFGNVWLNPPRGVENGKSVQGVWGNRMEQLYTKGDIFQGILLIRAVQGYDWYEQLVDKADRVAFLRERVKFLKPQEMNNGKENGKTADKIGTTLLYFGPNRTLFKQTFIDIARIL